jgi:hypothetical protein
MIAITYDQILARTRAAEAAARTPFVPTQRESALAEAIAHGVAESLSNMVPVPTPGGSDGAVVYWLPTDQAFAWGDPSADAAPFLTMHRGTSDAWEVQRRTKDGLLPYFRVGPEGHVSTHGFLYPGQAQGGIQANRYIYDLSVSGPFGYEATAFNSALLTDRDAGGWGGRVFFDQSRERSIVTDFADAPRKMIFKMKVAESFVFDLYTGLSKSEEQQKLTITQDLLEWRGTDSEVLLRSGTATAEAELLDSPVLELQASAWTGAAAASRTWMQYVDVVDATEHYYVARWNGAAVPVLAVDQDNTISVGGIMIPNVLAGGVDFGMSGARWVQVFTERVDAAYSSTTVGAIKVRNPNASGPSDVYFHNSADVLQGAVGYGNASYADTSRAGRMYLYKVDRDFVIADKHASNPGADIHMIVTAAGLVAVGGAAAPQASFTVGTLSAPAAGVHLGTDGRIFSGRAPTGSQQYDLAFRSGNNDVFGHLADNNTARIIAGLWNNPGADPAYPSGLHTFVGSATSHALSFRTANASVGVFSTTGHLGVGHQAPAERVHLYRTGAAARLQIHGDQTQEQALVFADGAAGSPTTRVKLYKPASGTDVRLSVGGADRLTVQDNGNVGVAGGVSAGYIQSDTATFQQRISVGFSSPYSHVTNADVKTTQNYRNVGVAVRLITGASGQAPGLMLEDASAAATALLTMDSGEALLYTRTTSGNFASTDLRVKVTAGTTKVYNVLEMQPTGGTNEGGEISLLGEGSNTQFSIDNFAGDLRIFTPTTGAKYVNMFSFGSGGSCGLKVQRGIEVGAPTGGDKGVGTINVQVDIYKNNTAYTNPDWVLEHWATGGRPTRYADRVPPGYERLSLDALETHIREYHRLPRFTDSPAGMFERSDLVLEKLEEYATHLIDLHHRLRRVERQMEAA